MGSQFCLGKMRLDLWNNLLILLIELWNNNLQLGGWFSNMVVIDI